MARAVLMLLLSSAALLAGCVERRIYLVSEPPGADVYIDGEFIGKTRADDDPEGPLYASFVYYGRREYTLRLPGYRTASGSMRLETPWYQYPPMDFFAEVLAPWKIVDRHHINVELEESNPADVDELYRNAFEFRYHSKADDRYEYGYWTRTWEPAVMKGSRPIEPRRP